jgi:AraC-like DNA-binding protein
MNDIIHVESISEAHKLLGLGTPRHPLISLVKQKDLDPITDGEGLKVVLDYYQVWLKDGIDCIVGYGRNSYDFSEGTLAFIKAGQLLSTTSVQKNHQSNGWILMFHPDLIRKSKLGSEIHNYGFFEYEAHEALHISDKERATLNEVVEKINGELEHNIDRHSQKIIISNLELLLDYCLRYYDRQFYTRTNLHQDHISKFESLLRNFYNATSEGDLSLPTVKYLGEAMNMSPYYLSDLLKKETGRNAQEHIHYFLIEKAKDRLMASSESISEIAYSLGFEYPQYFTKLFKSKTGLSPKEFRNS